MRSEGCCKLVLIYSNASAGTCVIHVCEAQARTQILLNENYLDGQCHGFSRGYAIGRMTAWAECDCVVASQERCRLKAKLGVTESAGTDWNHESEFGDAI